MELVIDIVYLREEGVNAFTGNRLEIKKFLLKAVYAGRGALVVVEEQLDPHLAGEASTEIDSKLLTAN